MGYKRECPVCKKKTRRRMMCLACFTKYKKYLAKIVDGLFFELMEELQKFDQKDKKVQNIRQYLYRAKTGKDFGDKSFLDILDFFRLNEFELISDFSEEEQEFLIDCWEAIADFEEAKSKTYNLNKCPICGEAKYETSISCANCLRKVRQVIREIVLNIDIKPKIQVLYRPFGISFKTLEKYFSPEQVLEGLNKLNKKDRDFFIEYTKLLKGDFK